MGELVNNLNVAGSWGCSLTLHKVMEVTVFIKSQMRVRDCEKFPIILRNLDGGGHTIHIDSSFPVTCGPRLNQLQYQVK